MLSGIDRFVRFIDTTNIMNHVAICIIFSFTLASAETFAPVVATNKAEVVALTQTSSLLKSLSGRKKLTQVGDMEIFQV